MESLNIRQLYQTGADRRHELKRLTRSIVAAFLDLLEILIRNPGSEERVAKIEDLRLLLFNTHHLINEYRPQQARETLQLMLEVFSFFSRYLARRKTDSGNTATIDR